MTTGMEENMRTDQLQQRTLDFLRGLFAPDPVPIVTDPLTGHRVVDVRQVCEKLGLDPEREMSKVMTDSVLSTGIVIVDKQA
jgi:hypothetical protein